MLREGRTASVPLDALPGKRTSSSGPLPLTQGLAASNVSPLRQSPLHVDSNSNSNMSDNFKNKLSPLVMPSQQNLGNGVMDKDIVHFSPPTNASLTTSSTPEILTSDSGRKRPSTTNFTPMISSKRSCLPFGYCYDTNDADLWLIDEDSDMKTESSLPQTEEDLWMLSDDRTPDMLLSNNPWINNRKNNRLKVTRDVGPTLAQLNSSSDVWDTLDLDELLSCSTVNPTSAMNQTPKNYNNNSLTGNHQSPNQQPSANCGPGKLGQTPRGIRKEKENIEVRSAIELQDPKLQANVEYLQNLVSNSVNQSTSSSESSSPTLNPNAANLKISMAKKNPVNKTSAQSFPQVGTHSLIPQNKKEFKDTAVTNCSIKVEKGEKRNPSSKKDVEQLGTKVAESIIQKVKQEQHSETDKAEIESHALKTIERAEKKVPSLRTPTEKRTSTRRTRNSNSQCTERSNGSSNDEGFVEETDPVDEDACMEDIEEDDDDNESEVMDSDDESFYGDYEAKDLLGATTSDDQENRWALNMGRSRKGGPQRYFWQYNVQAKGPKGSKSSLGELADHLDPHVLGEVSDPVFAPDCQVQGVKHAGKARRGDGNDLTPNPRKLLMIGLELKKLSKTINDLTPVADVPVAAHNKTRKEKNKLASRACRLKKKAQHEANKIKLYGLQNEHQKMLKLLADIKSQVRKILATDNNRKVASLTASMATLFNDGVGKVIVAGNTSDFVNSILDNVAAGQTDGGLH